MLLAVAKQMHQNFDVFVQNSHKKIAKMVYELWALSEEQIVHDSIEN